MNLLLITDDHDVFTLVESVVSDIGHTLERWKGDKSPVSDARVAIFDGLESLLGAPSFGCHVLVLAAEQDLALFCRVPARSD